MLAIVTRPFVFLIIASGAILLYYTITAATIRAHRTPDYNGLLSKGTWLDWLTTIIGFTPILVLIPSLFTIATLKNLPLPTMVLFYIYSIFFFAVIYSLFGWHKGDSFEMLANAEIMANGRFKNVAKGINWHTEWRYIVVSMQAQTSIGFTRMKPSRLRTETVSALQSIIGILFVSICIAKAVSTIAAQPTNTITICHCQNSK